MATNQLTMLLARHRAARRTEAMYQPTSERATKRPAPAGQMAGEVAQPRLAIVSRMRSHHRFAIVGHHHRPLQARDSGSRPALTDSSTMTVCASPPPGGRTPSMRAVWGDMILLFVTNMCSSVDGALGVPSTAAQDGNARTDVARDGEQWRDRAARRSYARSRRPVSRWTLSVRLATAAPADCRGGPGFLFDNPEPEFELVVAMLSRTTACNSRFWGPKFSEHQVATSISGRGRLLRPGLQPAVRGVVKQRLVHRRVEAGARGLSANSFHTAPFAYYGHTARPAARMAPTGNCFGRRRLFGRLSRPKRHRRVRAAGVGEFALAATIAGTPLPAKGL
jgi:hypothetical protein